jgi:hypothetical protein
VITHPQHNSPGPISILPGQAPHPALVVGIQQVGIRQLDMNPAVELPRSYSPMQREQGPSTHKESPVA